jgi:hypothetical protein
MQVCDLNMPVNLVTWELSMHQKVWYSVGWCSFIHTILQRVMVEVEAGYKVNLVCDFREAFMAVSIE